MYDIYVCLYVRFFAVSDGESARCTVKNGGGINKKTDKSVKIATERETAETILEF